MSFCALLVEIWSGFTEQSMTALALLLFTLLLFIICCFILIAVVLQRKIEEVETPTEGK